MPVKLTAEPFAKLKGKWQGKISVTNPQTSQKTELPVAVRFESNANGEYFGYLDSPAQGVSGMIVNFASLEGDKFTARVAAANAEYTGTLAGSKITGEWVQAQAGLRTPVELTKAP